MTIPTPARVAALLTTIALVLVLLLADAVGAGDSEPPERHHTLRVVTGDTLWDLAADYTAPGDDVRRTVFEIRRLNHLDDSVIVPGQVLLIPASD